MEAIKSLAQEPVRKQVEMLSSTSPTSNTHKQNVDNLNNPSKVSQNAEQIKETKRKILDFLIQTKRQGKTIIAVTHDDRYFHTADRVLKMEYGRLLGDQPE